MKPGILTSQFVTDTGIGSGMIRYLTDGQVSHVDLKVPCSEIVKRGHFEWRYAYGLLGARSKGGVQLRYPAYAKFTYINTLSVQVPDIDAAYDFAFAQIGKPYALHVIWDMFLHKQRPFTMDQKDWICDELNYAIVGAGGIQLLGCANPMNINPQVEMESPLWEPA